MIPVITAAVAPSRYTFECLTNGAKEFTINIPSNKNENAINITGSTSGRNTDKFKQAKLEIIPGKRTMVPTIKDGKPSVIYWGDSSSLRFKRNIKIKTIYLF